MIAGVIAIAATQLAPPAAEPRPFETTIAAIRANPKKFDGQVVRIHGYVNDCQTATCNLDERTAKAPGGPGQNLSIARDEKFDGIVRPLLPTYVEFDARVDSACLPALCLDRASVLTIVTLRSVVSPEPPPFENP